MSLFPSSESTVSSCLIGSFLTLGRLVGEEAAEVDTGVPVSVSSSFSSVGNDDSRFLLPLPAEAAVSGVSRDVLCCVAFVWRENIASMPSLRFWTGSINVGD